MNWAQRLARARRGGKGFTTKDCEMAGGFATCAVGEHRGLYVESGLYWCEPVPDDDELADYGVKFDVAVTDNDIDAAERTYAAIQEWFAKAKVRA